MKLTLLITALVLIAADPSASEQIQSIAVRSSANSAPAADLKPGPGQALVVANCIPCHSTALVAANHMNRSQWDKTITTMQQVNGMWPLPSQVRQRILDYLEKAQRVPDRGLDAGKTSPWAAPLYRPNPLWT